MKGVMDPQSCVHCMVPLWLFFVLKNEYKL